MPIADLSNVPISPQQLAWFAFAHADHHNRMITYIRKQYNIILPQYILDPIDTSPDSAWSDNHIIMHNNNDAVLGVTSYDISQIDWTQKNTLPGWIWIHYQLHYAEAQASGIW